jgi:uncharacterized membrane protein YkvA (DUF1232 family)
MDPAAAVRGAAAAVHPLKAGRHAILRRSLAPPRNPDGETPLRSSTPWKERVQALKRETFTLYLACRHPRCPWYAKLLALAVVGYALSPIDLIPDFIPVLGYVDDFVLIPLGILLVMRLIPPEVLAECRRQSDQIIGRVTRAGKIAAALIVALWFLTAVLLVWLVLRALG